MKHINFLRKYLR